MDRIERAANLSVARAIGFATLAILCGCAGLAAYPSAALRLAAGSTLLMAAILELKARQAPQRPYRRTEVWLLLEPRPQLPPAVAQRLIGTALERTFRRYARSAFATSLALWLASLAVRFSGAAGG